VLWELLAGDVPFVGENFVAVALRHVNEPAPSLRERRPDVSPRLEAAVDRALAKDPARRFPSMTAFAKELRACLAEVEGDPPAPEDDLALTLVTPPGHAPAPARSRPSYPKRSRRRGRVGWVVLALLAGGAALAAVVLLNGSSHHRGGSRGGGSPGSAVPLSGLSGYDPEGTGGEHDELAGLATDGNTSTAWTTETYGSQDFGGLKDGVGLLLDAGSSVTLARITVTTPTPGFSAQIQTGESSSGNFTPDSTTQSVSGTTTFTLQGKTGRYYIVWITQLPPLGGKAEISEVTATS